MIFVSVGTYILGFDELIIEMDKICEMKNIPAFAQIGNSTTTPTNMKYERFLPHTHMLDKIRDANLIICHSGLGIIGDTMRLNKKIIMVPRTNSDNSPQSPANDQSDFSKRISELYQIPICNNLNNLSNLIDEALFSENKLPQYNITNNVSELIAAFLKSH